MKFTFKKLTKRSWEALLDGRSVAIGADAKSDCSSPEAWGFLPSNLTQGEWIAMREELARQWKERDSL